jgi:anti-anti-sigma factor
MSKRNKPPVALQLPPELTIYAAAELHPQWLAWLAAASGPGREEAVVDAHAVDQVDAAGLQLLVSLERSLTDRGVRLRLNAPSSALHQACEALGLGEWLSASADLRQEGAAA